MRLRNQGILCMLLSLAVAADAVADAEYGYTGNTFTVVIDNTPPAGTTFTVADSVAGSFVIPAPLSANMALSDISGSVTAYSFSAGPLTLDESNSTLFGAFNVATDAAGDIVEWSITAVSGPSLPATGAPGDQRDVITTSDSGFFSLDRGILQECTGPGPSCGTVFSDLGQVANNAGVWNLLTSDAEIDIKPDSDSNPINPMSNGLIPVQIRGSASFDIGEIDRTTLAFGPNGAPPAHDEGGHIQVSRGGGFGALLVHFATPETGIAFGDTEAGVTGELLDGTPFEGCDDIRTVPACGIGFELALLLPGMMWLRRRRQLVT